MASQVGVPPLAGLIYDFCRSLMVKANFCSVLHNSNTLLDMLILGRIIQEAEKMCQVQEPQFQVLCFLVISPDSIW